MKRLNLQSIGSGNILLPEEKKAIMGGATPPGGGSDWFWCCALENVDSGGNSICGIYCPDSNATVW